MLPGRKLCNPDCTVCKLDLGGESGNRPPTYRPLGIIDPVRGKEPGERRDKNNTATVWGAVSLMYPRVAVVRAATYQLLSQLDHRFHLIPLLGRGCLLEI